MLQALRKPGWSSIATRQYLRDNHTRANIIAQAFKQQGTTLTISVTIDLEITIIIGVQSTCSLARLARVMFGHTSQPLNVSDSVGAIWGPLQPHIASDMGSLGGSHH